MSLGSIANLYDYSPFGKLVLNTESVANVFKFSSEYAEKETGLIYYNYRYYNPSTGKWLSRDPIQENGGINLYALVNNDVANYWDLLGKKCVPKLVTGSFTAIGKNYAKEKGWWFDEFSYSGWVNPSDSGLTISVSAYGYSFLYMREGYAIAKDLSVSVSCYCNKNDGKCYASISSTGDGNDTDYPVSVTVVAGISSSGDSATARVSGGAAFLAKGKGKIGGSVGGKVGAVNAEIEFESTKHQRSFQLGSYTWVCEKQ
ncbi:RHS repeat-associated core domain-containing protein [Lentisphaerota bacterium WC36G]|nr:RHS repeat-associated core domain-containing protein [Lentisphaerae bacterium WC36]